MEWKIKKSEEFADQRALLHDQLSALDVARPQSKAMREINEPDVEAMLAIMIKGLPELDRNALKDMLGGLKEPIILDPKIKP